MQRFEVSGAVRPIYGSLGVKRLRGTTTILLSSSACRVRPTSRSTDESTTPWQVIEAVTAWFSKLFSHHGLVLQVVFIQFPNCQNNPLYDQWISCINITAMQENWDAVQLSKANSEPLTTLSIRSTKIPL